MAYPEGLEPPTSWSVAKRSIQLSYGYVSRNGARAYHMCGRSFNFKTHAGVGPSAEFARAEPGFAVCNID